MIVLLFLLWLLAGSGWAVLAAVAAGGAALGIFVGRDVLAILRGR